MVKHYMQASKGQLWNFELQAESYSMVRGQ